MKTQNSVTNKICILHKINSKTDVCRKYIYIFFLFFILECIRLAWAKDSEVQNVLV